MTDKEHDYFRPLCPKHYSVMVISPNAYQAVPDTSERINMHHCQCPVDGCPQNYSPGFGYFTIARHDDYWHTTGSSSLQINRSPKQVICGEHKDAMFLESFDAKTNVETFRCPQKSCQQTIEVPADGPPVYWLGSGYFRSP